VHEGIPTPIKKNEVCKYFKSSCCRKGDDCPFSHDLKKEPCRFFHLSGHCFQGENCKYSHEELSPEAIEIFRAQIDKQFPQNDQQNDQQSTEIQLPVFTSSLELAPSQPQSSVSPPPSSVFKQPSPSLSPPLSTTATTTVTSTLPQQSSTQTAFHSSSLPTITSFQSPFHTIAINTNGANSLFMSDLNRPQQQVPFKMATPLPQQSFNTTTTTTTTSSASSLSPTNKSFFQKPPGNALPNFTTNSSTNTTVTGGTQMDPRSPLFPSQIQFTHKPTTTFTSQKQSAAELLSSILPQTQ